MARTFNLGHQIDNGGGDGDGDYGMIKKGNEKER